jgi:O-antigen/teichoic acid export membrane protein
VPHKSAEFYFQDHKPSGELGRQAVRGGVVSVVGGYGIGVLQVVSAIVLARLLTPEDFGLVAIITALTNFAPFLIDFGMGDATKQRPKITQGQVSSLFWLSSGVGFAIAVLLAACGPLIASSFGNPRLESVALYSAITFALSGISCQHLSLLRRALQFTTVAKIQFISVLAGVGAAILAAICGLHYWALVLRPMVSAGCLAAGAWLACRWKPGIPVFDDEVKSMIRYGMHVVGFSFVYSLSRSADRIALGLVYQPKEVGFYQNAMTLYDNAITSPLAQLHIVGSAALGKLQSNHAAIQEKYEAALSALAFFVMPASAILSVTGQDLVTILMGEKWRIAGSLMSIIALRGIFQVIEGSQGWLHLSLGRPDRWKNWGIVSAIVQVAAILMGLPFGVTGVAIATVISGAVIAFPAVIYAGRPAGVGATLLVRAVGRQLVGATFTVAAGWSFQTVALEHFSGLARILLSTSFCASIYLMIVVGLFRLTKPIAVAAGVVRGHPSAASALRWIRAPS